MNKGAGRDRQDWILERLDSSSYEYANPITDDIKMELEKLAGKDRRTDTGAYNVLSRGDSRRLPILYAAPKRNDPYPDDYIHGVGK